MIANSVSASSMPRLPVSWREFSELLRIRTSEAMRPSHERTVESVKEGRLDIRSDGSSNQQDQHRHATNQTEQPTRPIAQSSNGATTPVSPGNAPPVIPKSSRAEYPNGFEAFA